MLKKLHILVSEPSLLLHPELLLHALTFSDQCLTKFDGMNKLIFYFELNQQQSTFATEKRHIPSILYGNVSLL